MQQQESVPRFDWPEIIRAVIIIAIGILAFNLILPVISALVNQTGSTSPLAGNDVFLWVSRGVMWALIIWRGSAMLQVVGDRIVDDMLIVAALSAVIWLVVKIVVLVVVYQGVKADGTPIPFIHINDLLGMAAAVGISWLGAKANTR